MIKIKRSSKYHAVKTYVGGIKLDSKKEARRYSELLLMQTAGVIQNLRRQVRFELQPAYTKANGEHVKNIVYVADFVYFDTRRNSMVIEDTKGVKTQVYKLKKKMFEYVYPTYCFIET